MRILTKKLVMTIVGVILAAFLVIQLVPYGRAHSNPPVIMEPSWDSPITRDLTVKACFDCHSNQVVWPWYSNIAPISWWVQDHVVEGRSELNFSEWDRNQEEAYEAAETVLEGEMPPSYYKPWSRMSQTDLDNLVTGLEATLGTAKVEEHRDNDDDDD
jgi:hypothetical protein